MIEELRKAIDSEIAILREISIFLKKMDSVAPNERKLLMDSVANLREKMKAINNSIPELLNRMPGIAVEPAKKILAEKSTERGIMPKIKEREKFLRELEIKEDIIKKLRRKGVVEKKEKEEIIEFKQARGYLKLSNRLFLDRAKLLMKKGYFSSLPAEIKRANLDVLSEAYVAMMLFTVFISIFAFFIVAVLLLFFSFEFSWPFISVYEGSILTRILEVFWIPIVAPVAVFLIIYFYPTVEKRSISKRIDEELPFAVIHMSSISGSGIEPSEIFKIIGLSKEYPFLRKEIRKVMNQINIYGYDLVTALNNVAQGTSNKRLTELFNGLSTTINSGGSLSEFFEKRADTLMASYRLEKEKFIRVAETFMDIYISVVIAAPMILMLLLVMISVSGIQTGFSPYELTIITISGVAVINIIFLVFLQMKQG